MIAYRGRGTDKHFETQGEWIQMPMVNTKGNLNSCMQDTFASATHSAGQARRATIGYLVYNLTSHTKNLDRILNTIPYEKRIRTV